MSAGDAALAESRPAARAGGTPLVRLDGVTVAFGRTVALETVSLAVEAGEIVTLIGPNGSGKSTLLRVALGLQKPTRGTVSRRADLTVGYVPQRLVIDRAMPLTVRRFLALAVPRGTSVEPALEEVGVPRLGDQPVQVLSGGEWQRVLLARALLRSPELLVLDEPVQGVDVAGQAELYDLIRRIRDRRGCAILLVSHDLHFVMAAADRVVCLNRHVCCSGTPGAVARDPAYGALFGPAAEAVALYAHRHDHRHG